MFVCLQKRKYQKLNNILSSFKKLELLKISLTFTIKNVVVPKKNNEIKSYLMGIWKCEGAEFKESNIIWILILGQDKINLK